jgi:hypothetical protein
MGHLHGHVASREHINQQCTSQILWVQHCIPPHQGICSHVWVLLLTCVRACRGWVVPEVTNSGGRVPHPLEEGSAWHKKFDTSCQYVWNMLLYTHLG